MRWQLSRGRRATAGQLPGEYAIETREPAEFDLAKLERLRAESSYAAENRRLRRDSPAVPEALSL
jgi:hypothetical protein